MIKAEKLASKRLSVNSDANILTQNVTEIKSNYKAQFDLIDSELNCNLAALREKQIKDTQSVYYNMFKAIRDVQMSSLEPVSFD